MRNASFTFDEESLLRNSLMLAYRVCQGNCTHYRAFAGDTNGHATGRVQRSPEERCGGAILT